MMSFLLRLLPAIEGMRIGISVYRWSRIQSVWACYLVCLFTIFLLLITQPYASVAQVSSAVLSERISKTWKMEKLVMGNKVTAGEQGEGAFLLILHADHTIEQGLFPDGMIKGTWTVDEEKRLLSIKDTETSVVYQMKVISISAGELILQTSEDPNGTTIYYKAR